MLYAIITGPNKAFFSVSCRRQCERKTERNTKKKKKANPHNKHPDTHTDKQRRKMIEMNFR